VTLIAICTIHGQRVGWYDDGRVHMTRALADSLPQHLRGRLLPCHTAREFAAWCEQIADASALKSAPPGYERAPEHDRRFSRGDDFAGDAWRNRRTGALRYVAVGTIPAPQVAG